jgi:hypothetical protein
MLVVHLLKPLIIKIMKLKSIFLLATTSVILISCEGPEGPAGQNGVDGNANVKAYVYNNLNWTTNGGVATANGSCQGITSEIMATGAVLGYASYVQSNGAELQWLLPYTTVEETYQENLLMIYSQGAWVLENTASDDVPSIYAAVPKLKVVVISGLSGKQAGFTPNLSWEDLVKRYPNMEYIYVN